MFLKNDEVFNLCVFKVYFLYFKDFPFIYLMYSLICIDPVANDNFAGMDDIFYQVTKCLFSLLVCLFFVKNIR